MRILVIEDEHRIANTLKKGLQQEHYVVDLAYTGTDGYDLAADGTYEVIILDVMLPGMDGIALCKKLRQENIHTPILLLTAKGQIQDKVLGLDAGADDYLAKPFSFEELLARLRALARRPVTTSTNTLQVADLVLDPISFKITRAGKDIRLSSKEFSLLEYFLRHSGQVLSKNHIMTHVWNYDTDILPNTIEVYIRNLRQKIDKPFNGPALFKTIRGFGYKLGD